MNELTGAQIGLYVISGILLYLLGFVIGVIWSDYKKYTRHPRHGSYRNRTNVKPGFNPNNPVNSNSHTWATQSVPIMGDNGYTWYERRSTNGHKMG